VEAVPPKIIIEKYCWCKVVFLGKGPKSAKSSRDQWTIEFMRFENKDGGWLHISNTIGVEV
jgi:hypothetical protein